MADNVAVFFHQSAAPYEAGDVAGFPPDRARALVDKGIASFVAPQAAAPVDQFTTMDRAALIAFAHDHLGMTDEPPADVGDDDLRDALRKQVLAQTAAQSDVPSADAAKPAKAVKGQ